MTSLSPSAELEHSGVALDSPRHKYGVKRCEQQPQECQWIEDDPFHGTGEKCRQPVVKGSPSCRYHHDRAYVGTKSKPEDLVGDRS